MRDTKHFDNLGDSVERLISDTIGGRESSVFGLGFAHKTIIASRLATSGVVVYVCDDYFRAGEALAQLSESLGKDCVIYFGAKDDVLSYRRAKSKDYDYDRLKALTQIRNKTARCIVTTSRALAQPIIAPNIFDEYCFGITVGQSIALDTLPTRFVDMGYTRVPIIDSKGQYSIRGDILDVWTVDSDKPFRIELFDNLVESIKLFDSETGLSLSSIDSAGIVPSSEFVASSEQRTQYINTLRGIKDSKVASDIILQLERGEVSSSLCVLFGQFADISTGFDRFLEYYKDSNKAIFTVFDDAKSVVDSLDIAISEHNNRAKALLLSGDILPKFTCLIDSPFEFGIRLAFHDFDTQNRIFAPKNVCKLDTMPLPSYVHDYHALESDILAWGSKGYKIYVLLTDSDKIDMIGKWIADNHLNEYVTLLSCSLDYGAIFADGKKVFLGRYNLFKKHKANKVRRAKQAVFNQPDVGDYVVHSVHGIGVYKGVERHNLTGAIRDYIVVKYKDEDTLYLPAESMDTLCKYIAVKDPVVNKIGGVEFGRLKDRVRQSVKKLAIDLVQLYAERDKSKGHVYTADEGLYREFSNRFEYEETDDQSSAIEDALNDLRTGKIMDRLICGDVGYGKTEVAMRAAFRVVLEGHQVAFVSPTTILARQHYHTLVRRMSDFGIRVASLTRLDDKAAIADTLKKVLTGEIDIVVGTHRVLSSDVVFKNLGLLVLDEEQKFGVGDKEKIKNIKSTINVLTLSATPIPRTLHMSLSGIRDISLLDTPPINRIPVQTYVATLTDSLLVDAVRRELGRGGSVFVVYNRVEHMSSFVAYLQSLLGDVKISCVHGQMAHSSVEDNIFGFVSGDVDVLVASTIIENGIDMPRANTIIVVDSDRLGLAQMYQLRGRVGRGDRQAYAYFTFDEGNVLTETASKRLLAINEFTQLGSGYKLAMRDLEIRGAGNVLGREQHGHMDKVGYDMYCKLLSQAIDQVKGNNSDRYNTDIKVVTDKPAYISDQYIPDETSRLNLYSRIARLGSLKDREILHSEINDIYGAPPAATANLLVLGLIKNLAAFNNASTVVLRKSEIAISYNKLNDIPTRLSQLIKDGICVFEQSPRITVRFDSVKDMISALS